MIVAAAAELAVFLIEGGSANLLLLFMGIAFAAWYLQFAFRHRD